MQQEFNTEYPTLDIQLLGVNSRAAAFASQNMAAAADLPLLQDADINGMGDVWHDLWDVNDRDVIILDRDNSVADVYSLQIQDLGNPTNYQTLRQMFIDAATTTPLGDFNNDGALDLADIDLLFGVGDLVSGVSLPPAEPIYDLTADNVVDGSDVDAWLAEAASHNGFGAPYLKGDANLDGTVDAQDLNTLALRWQQTQQVWSTGDFTGEGTVNALDLNQIGLNWQSSIPIAAASQAVPEPSGVALLIASGCALLAATRQRGRRRNRMAPRAYR
jgi:hypothetical protein